MLTTTAPHRPDTATGTATGTGPETEADAAPETRTDDPAPVPAARGRFGPFRKVGVAVAGTVVIGAGIVMLVIPGPGLVVILAGIGILGTEFPAAKRVSEACLRHIRTAWAKIRRKN